MMADYAAEGRGMLSLFDDKYKVYDIMEKAMESEYALFKLHRDYQSQELRRHEGE